MIARTQLVCLAWLVAALPSVALATENVSFTFADVLRADPVFETVRYREPREECFDQDVVVRERGRRSSGGAVAGAIIGGVLGSQVGSGDGRRAATAAGAIIGGAVGHDSDRRRSGPDREYETTERHCRTIEVEREERRITGYDVEYRLKDDVFFSRLAYDPGNKLRVRVAVSPAD